MKKPIKQIKKELGIKNADIAKAFGYVNANSYATSTAKPRLQNGIEWLYETIKSVMKPSQSFDNLKDIDDEPIF
jgi:hypothetical protein